MNTPKWFYWHCWLLTFQSPIYGHPFDYILTLLLQKIPQFPPMPSQITYGWPNFSSKISFFLHFPQIPFLCSKFFNLKEHVLLYHKKKKKNSRTFDYPRWWEYYWPDYSWFGEKHCISCWLMYCYFYFIVYFIQNIRIIYFYKFFFSSIFKEACSLP